LDVKRILKGINMSNLTKADFKQIMHEVLDEHGHTCFMNQEQQNDTLDGVKVVHRIKGFFSFGIALFLTVGAVLGLLGFLFYKPIMSFFMS